MNIRHEAVKIKDMSFKTEYVSGKTFKLTLSNSMKEIRFKIPKEATLHEVADVTGAVFSFLEYHKDYEVEFSLRGHINHLGKNIYITLGVPSNKSILKSENVQ